MNVNENVTTIADIVCLLKLYSRENDYFSSDSHNQILKILSNQQFNSKLSTYQNDPLIKIYHKTGELNGVEHDAAIMEANGRTIEVAVLTEDWENNGDAQLHDRNRASINELYNQLIYIHNMGV